MYCMYFACIYAQHCTLKFVMTVSLGCIHDDDYRLGGSFAAFSPAIDQCWYGRVTSNLIFKMRISTDAGRIKECQCVLIETLYNYWVYAIVRARRAQAVPCSTSTRGP